MSARRQAVRYSAWADVRACLLAIMLAGLSLLAVRAGLVALALWAAGGQP